MQTREHMMVSWGSRLGLSGALAIHPNCPTEALESPPLPMITGAAWWFERKKKVIE